MPLLKPVMICFIVHAGLFIERVFMQLVFVMSNENSVCFFSILNLYLESFISESICSEASFGSLGDFGLERGLEMLVIESKQWSMDGKDS